MNSSLSKNKILQNHYCVVEKCSQRFDAYEENIVVSCFGCKQQFYGECFDIEFDPKKEKPFFAVSHVQFICFDCFHKLKSANKPETQISSPGYKSSCKTNANLKLAEKSINASIDLTVSKRSETESADALKPPSSSFSLPDSSTFNLNAFATEIRANFANLNSKFDCVFGNPERKYTTFDIVKRLSTHRKIIASFYIK